MQAYEKEYWRLFNYKRILRENHQNCRSTKEKYLTTDLALARKDGKLFCKKRIIVKAGIPPSISEETIRRLLQKTDLKWTRF